MAQFTGMPLGFQRGMVGAHEKGILRVNDTKKGTFSAIFDLIGATFVLFLTLRAHLFKNILTWILSIINQVNCTIQMQNCEKKIKKKN